MDNQKFNLKQNSFDILKYWAAFSVIFLHYTYYAFREAEQVWGVMDKLRRTSEFLPGVIVLFTVSGFLISDSMERSKTKGEFLRKRVFRLYPELWFCTIVNVIVLCFLPYALWFMIGAFCYQYKDKIIKYLRYLTIPLLVIYFLLRPYATGQPGYYVGIGISILCPFLVIGLAYLLPKVRIKTDLTYGMFLYHWIVLNIIVHFEWLSKWKWYACFLFFIIITLFLVWSSQKIAKKIVNRL